MDAVFKEELDETIGDSAEAFDRYESFVSRTVCKFSFNIKRSSGFLARSKVYSAGGFTLGRFTITAGGGEMIRGRKEIRQDLRNAFGLYFPIRGDHEVTQFSRTQKCSPGTLSLVAMEEPFKQVKSGNNDTFCFVMPRDFVNHRLARSDEICARSVAVRGGLGSLLYDMVQAFHRGADAMSGTEIHRAMHLMGELAILTLGSSADALSDIRSARAGNLARAKLAIRANFTNPELTIGDIARECRISMRYLHELFHADGETVSEYIKRQRLQHARFLLQQNGGGTTVTEIALSCGFSSASQFSTAFRQAFGITPRDLMRHSR